MKKISLPVVILCLGSFGFTTRAQTAPVVAPGAIAIAEADVTETDPKAKDKTAKRDEKAKTGTDAPKSDAPKKSVAAPKSDAPPLAGARTLAPEKANPVRVTRFEVPPVIDGKPDDAVWKTAAAFKDFVQINPGDNTKPSLPTEVFMGYDAKTLYILFHAFDEPGKVRATVAKRDDVLNAEDSVRVLLDTFNDQRKAYVLCFNPLGIQQDGIRTEGVNVDFSVDIVMESKGALTEDGYVVEVAIPFKSLRYEAGKDKQWGLQIFRIIQRLNGEQDSWMPISRDVNGLLNQAGHISGLEGVSTERTLELIPSLTVSETGKRLPHFAPVPNDPGRMVNQPVGLDPGLTVKFGVTPTSTLNLAINPDFAQVEADATVVTTNQRFPIFFQEKRPFFLEG
ncbi:MAG TPA: sugar-binding protein, partial [Pyrinomonadaceae bacterium]|nr:sugar-binding protein [Pyrinomonadaceae bacterium]